MRQAESTRMNDADLVSLAIGGQRSATEQLVRRWSGRLTGYLRGRVASPEVAEDLAQEVLLRALKSLPSLADPSRFGSWLLSIAHHAAQDWHKAKARSEVSLHTPAAGQSECCVQTREASPSKQCEMKEERERILREVDQLPDRLREVLLIYYYDTVTYAEMAEMLNVSVATINARLTQARSELRCRLIRAGSTP